MVGTASANGDANCYRKRNSYSKKFVKDNPFVCDGCPYNSKKPLSRAVESLKLMRKLVGFINGIDENAYLDYLIALENTKLDALDGAIIKVISASFEYL